MNRGAGRTPTPKERKVAKLYEQGFRHQQAGAWRDAARAYRAALEKEPKFYQAWTNLGDCMRRLGRDAEALNALERASRIRPNDYTVAVNHGLCLSAVERFEEALARFRVALAAAPRDPAPPILAAKMLAKLARLDEAADLLAAAQKQVEDPHALDRALSDLLSALGRREEEAELWERRAAAYPDDLEVLSLALRARETMCDWPNAAAARERLIEGVRSGAKRAPRPFFMLSSLEDRALLRRNAERFTAQHGIAEDVIARERIDPPLAPPRADGRLRVGYLTDEFRDHPIGQLTTGVFREHDPDAVAFFAFSHGAELEDPYQDLVRDRAARFVNISQATDVEAARAIAEAELDILVDLKGYTRDSRVRIAALRPAPIQATWLGFPGTTGADYLDFAIVDRTICPPEHVEDFTETLAYLPHSYQSTDNQATIADTPATRAEAGLPDDAVVLCSFCVAYKIDAVRFESWMEILKRVEKAVLWLFEPGPAGREHLLREAAAQGVSPERVIIAPRLPKAEHLRRIGHADLGLDTRIYNGHTTTSDMLWGGVPVLATIGEQFASRVSASLLTAAGLGDLVACDEAAFVEAGVRLASDRRRLAALRARVAEAKERSHLFATQAFTRDLEALYRAMVLRARRGALGDRTPLMAEEEV